VKRTIFRLQLIVALLLSLSPLASASDTARHAILSRMFTTGDYFGFPGETSAPFTCNSTTERSTYYDLTVHAGYVCNGTSWTSTSSTVSASGNNTFTGTNTFQDGAKFQILNVADSATIEFSGSAITPSATRVVTIPDSNTTIPIVSQAITFSGMSAARTYILPDAGTTILTSFNPVTLAQGGTGAGISASNGGIFYSNATTGALLAGTATANQILLSGASTTPAWSTVTYPATAANNTTLVSNGTALSATALPACTDSGGNHLNYNAGSFTCGTSSSSSAWSGITNPASNLSLTMAANTSTFTFNATTGAGTNLFTLVDTTNNTGTGVILFPQTASGSSAIPFEATAKGTTNGFEVDASGNPTALGSVALRASTTLTTCTTPQFQLGTNGRGFSDLGSATAIYVCASSTPVVHMGQNLYVGGTGDIGFSANSDTSIALADTEMVRATVGVIKATDSGGSTNGWFAQPAAYGYVAADVTNATASLAVVTGASSPLKASRNYSFVLTLQVDNSTAADGVQIDFNGGAATATNFIAYCTIIANGATTTTTRLTALNSTCSQATLTGNGQVLVTGTIEVNGAGTFIVRAAEVAHTAGTLTSRRGSLLQMTDLSS
jgi:hypothetical protein